MPRSPSYAPSERKPPPSPHLPVTHRRDPTRLYHASSSGLTHDMQSMRRCWGISFLQIYGSTYTLTSVHPLALRGAVVH